ncbi:propionyl-CoA synthetase [Shewanella sp. 202IG2-18]|uniref:propionyl-CoA synthetase n=1 Tax=Parashewanella hymeniacidonis TaxID=2807618 RepID=UPI001960424D|nr:propionyl-CoA synthetase [Parashewanella hymeniacidonis]MBM7071583.1 propionyl-CoA synthetase [Parashewanella hymeniacidonis]
MSYQEEYLQSIENSEAFWHQKAGLIDWYKSPKRPLSQDAEGFHRWYADGELNTSYLALDYHVSQGRGDQDAIIYDSPVTNTIKKITYSELTEQVAKFAGALQSLGVEKGDRVVIYMPMVPEAAVAMLACARLGAVHSVVFGGFAPHELAVRIEDATPKVIVSASCGIEVDKVLPYKPLLDDAIEQSEHKPSHCVILQRPQVNAELIEGRDLDWAELTSKASPADPVALKGTDPLYILYTSGTTGKPKGVMRDNGGHAVALRYSMDTVYGVEPGDVYWAASDVGWVVGHSYIVYAPLLTGCTTIIYEGKPVKTPDAGAFWRVCAEHNVKTMFTAPTAFRAVRKDDPEAEFLKQYDLSKLERLYLAGERLDPPTYHWLQEKTGLPLVDHWWQTETGWPIAANPVGLEMMETKPGSATVPVPGFNIDILDESGEKLTTNEQGFVAIQLPLPPGCLPTIWGDSDRFRRSYLEQFPGYYVSGDGGYIDDDGYLFIMGRTDDVINVAGHRLSTGEMEEIVASHHAIAECAVIGVQDELKGQLPLGLVVLKDGIELQHQTIQKELVHLVREQIGAIACFKTALIVERLPKTRSGKILRKVLRQIVDGQEYVIPSTIDDPAILDEIKQQLRPF